MRGGAILVVLVAWLAGCAGTPMPAPTSDAPDPLTPSAGEDNDSEASGPLAPSVTPGLYDPHGGFPSRCWYFGFLVTGKLDTGVALRTDDAAAEQRARFNATFRAAGFEVRDDRRDVLGTRPEENIVASPAPDPNWTVKLERRGFFVEGCNSTNEEQQWAKVEPEIRALYVGIANGTAYSWDGNLTRSPMRVVN